MLADRGIKIRVCKRQESERKGVICGVGGTGPATRRTKRRKKTEEG